ncbi:MAG: protein translocase subunit SecF [Patescibacteria group bacterium]|jgi:preprotein translocase subunit SecF
MRNYKIIKNSKIWLSLSTVLVTLSVVALFLWGLKPGLDFTGGSLLEVEFAGTQPTVAEINEVFAQTDFGNLVIQPTGSNTIILRFQETSREKHNQAITALESLEQAEAGLTEIRFESIGSSVGAELRSRAFWLVFFALLIIIIYITFAFRVVSKPVPSWKYGLISIVSLAHNILLTCGVFAVLGHFFGTEVNTTFIVALLTVLGYSINDTIVVFDRVRENLPKSHLSFEETVNDSLNQAFVRSVNTTTTTLLALLSILIFGGESIKDFVLALVIGISCGAYSSLFLAAPLLVLTEKRQRRRLQKN